MERVPWLWWSPQCGELPARSVGAARPCSSSLGSQHLSAGFRFFGREHNNLKIGNKDADLLENGLEDMGRGKGKL